MGDWVEGEEIRELLGGICVKTLQRYRSTHWLEGIHFSKPVQRCFYNRPMIEHWRIHGNSPEHHQAIDNFYRQSQPKGRRRSG
jgi:Putative excisionase (DUF1233)